LGEFVIPSWNLFSLVLNLKPRLLVCRILYLFGSLLCLVAVLLVGVSREYFGSLRIYSFYFAVRIVRSCFT
jgi:hypothetical protein